MRDSFFKHYESGSSHRKQRLLQQTLNISVAQQPRTVLKESDLSICVYTTAAMAIVVIHTVNNKAGIEI